MIYSYLEMVQPIQTLIFIWINLVYYSFGSTSKIWEFYCMENSYNQEAILQAFFYGFTENYKLKACYITNSTPT